ncbi:MAG: tyrosine-type recombinase/integrase [Gammaproteobacteria bacterium]
MGLDNRLRINNHGKHVFTYRGNRLKGVDNKTWKRACRRAGIEDFRWHDLRHTYASWHVQAGTSLPILMELGGWSCYEMVLRYAHLASDHLYHAADKIDVPEVKTARDRATLVNESATLQGGPTTGEK